MLNKEWFKHWCELLLLCDLLQANN